MSLPSASFRSSSSPDETAKFLAARSDGFGARIRAVINAIALARAPDEDFLVYWPEKDATYHGVPPDEKTFSPLFVARYCLDPRTVKPSSFTRRYRPFRLCHSKQRLLETPHIKVENYLGKNRLAAPFRSKSKLAYCITHKECSAGRDAVRKLLPLAEAGNVGALLCAALGAAEPLNQKYAIEFLGKRSGALGAFDADVRKAANMTAPPSEETP